MKLLEIQESLGFDSAMVQPNRQFLSEANLLQVAKGGSVYIYVYLFNDILVLTTQKKPNKKTPKQTRKLEKIIPLR